MNKEIKRLCKTGSTLKAFHLFTQRIDHSKLSDITLNTLLSGCKRLTDNREASGTASHIWNIFISEYKVTPSLKSYCFVINILARNNENKQYVYKLIGELKRRHNYDKFSAHDWWALIDTFGLLQDIENMLHEYNVMLHEFKHIELNKYILGSILQGLIRCDHTQYVGQIWKDVVGKQADLSLLCDSFVLQSFIVCIDKSRHYHLDNQLLLNVWKSIVDEAGIQPDTGCYCMAILAFSRKQCEIHHNKASDLLRDIDINSLNEIHFRQILSAFGNIGDFDLMWTAYNQYIAHNGDKHDLMALSVLASKEKRSEKISNILKIVIAHFDLDKGIEVDQLMSFYRVAVKYDDQHSADVIWGVLERRKNSKTNVVAKFWYNDEEHVVESGYITNCKFNAMNKVDALMKQMDYKMDVSNVPELPHQFAREKVLKSHSEKKALAILILNRKKIKHIRISVAMRMCNDCHKFFCHVSRVYNDRIIECIDPKGIHTFKDGICLLCY